MAVRRIHDGQVTHKWIAEFPEAVAALEASGASPEGVTREKEKAVFEVANYLWRSLKPERAREFLLKELGEKAKSTALYRKTALPRCALALAKEARRCYLMARYHPALASEEVHKIYALIDPLIAREKL
jgi:hypothetical protein